jgi:hypothetical protein
MRYDCTVRGPGGHEVVSVEAASGDEAASRAYRAGTTIICVTPTPFDTLPPTLASIKTTLSLKAD